MTAGRDFSPVQHWTQGLARVANAIAGNVQEGRAADAEQTGRRDAIAAALAAINGGGAAIPPVPAAGGAPVAPIGPVSSAPIAPPEQGVQVAETEADVQRLERSTGQYVAPDLDKVVRTVYGEAGNQAPVGQQAVAAVIANRAKQSGMTPTDVVMAKGQFEPWSNPAARARMEALTPENPKYQRIAAAITPVLTGEAPDPTNGATHFYAPKAQAALGRPAPAWDNGAGVDLGDHRFFSLGYKGTGRTQLAQAPVADMPAEGAQEAQFAIPGQAPQPSPAASQPNAAAIQALSNPFLPAPLAAALAAKLSPEKAQFQTDAEGNIIALDPSGRAPPKVVYKAAVKPDISPVQMKDANGNETTVFLDKRSGRIVSPQELGAPAAEAPSNPYAAGGKMTEEQAKAAGYVNRMVESHNVMNGLDATATDGSQAIKGSVPVVGNYLVSGEKQKLVQAQRDFVNSILRRESGAAIAPSEFENAQKQYFPQPGDGSDVIAQKRRDREIAIEGVMTSAGKAYKPPATYRKSAAEPQSAPSETISAAKAAIARGAPRDAVIKRLRDSGIDPAGL